MLSKRHETVQKRTGGRPRKYRNNAARCRAYRQRLNRASDPAQAAKDQRYALMRLGEHAALMPDRATLWHGDFREMGRSIPDASVALALCDPPYGKAWLSHVDGFGALCARVLKPGASLLMLYGQMYLPDVLHTLATHLRYHWLCSYQLKSAAAAIWPRRIMNHWKPLIWCTQGEYTGEYQGDVLMGEGKDKRSKRVTASFTLARNDAGSWASMGLFLTAALPCAISRPCGRQRQGEGGRANRGLCTTATAVCGPHAVAL
jgi:hypothetical protein